MTTISVCMYCGTDSETGLHIKCHVMLNKMREDMKALAPKDKWLVFQAAEMGAYGTVESVEPEVIEQQPERGFRLPAKRKPGRKRIHPVKAKMNRSPDFFEKACELMNDGFTQLGTVKWLNANGWTNRDGNEITIDSLKARLWLARKKAE